MRFFSFSLDPHFLKGFENLFQPTYPLFSKDVVLLNERETLSFKAMDKILGKIDGMGTKTCDFAEQHCNKFYWVA